MVGLSTAQRTFFDVEPADLGQLAPSEAVFVLREMLWAEAFRLKIAVTSVEVPFAITDPDGGIDADVTAIPGGAESALIYPPRTSFQVKTGAFAAKTDSEIESLLIKPSAIQARRAAARAKKPKKITHHNYDRDDLSPRVRACLDAGGTFIVVLFGVDTPDTADEETRQKIISQLTKVDSKYSNASVRIWRQSTLCGLLRNFSCGPVPTPSWFSAHSH